MRTGSQAGPVFTGCVLALVVAASSLTGCSSAKSDGALSGTATPCMGPVAIPSGFRQHITVKQLDGSTVVQAGGVASPYRFKFSLKPGTYEVSAIAAHTLTTRVRSGTTTTVNLFDNCT
jgi:hypothetical protein